MWAQQLIDSRNALALTQNQVEELTVQCGTRIAQRTVSDLEHGKISPITLSVERFYTLMAVLRLNPAEFAAKFKFDLPQFAPPQLPPAPSARPLMGKLVPLLGSANGGSKAAAPDPYVEVAPSYYRPGAVALVVVGDSMTDPRDPGGEHSLQEGDTILVDTGLLRPMHAKLYAIQLDGGALVVKRADRLPNGEWWLRSYNETQHPAFQWDEAEIKGMVYAKVPKPVMLG